MVETPAGGAGTAPVLVYCFDANFCKFAAASAISAVEHSASDLKIYWLVPADDVGFVTSIAGQLQTNVARQICVKGVDDALFSGWKISHHFSRATYLRYLVPSFVDEPKAIYLDADTLVLGDLTELYSIELGDKLLGGVVDIFAGGTSRIPRSGSDIYINGGMLLMNLRALRDDDFLGKAVAVYQQFEQDVQWVDQCVTNKYAEGRKAELDPKWNRLLFIEALSGADFRRFADSSSIVHFAGSNKPWHRWCNRQIFDFWWTYARKVKPSIIPLAFTGEDGAVSEAWNNIRRIEPCPCGSGKRYKSCHGAPPTPWRLDENGKVVFL